MGTEGVHVTICIGANQQAAVTAHSSDITLRLRRRTLRRLCESHWAWVGLKVDHHHLIYILVDLVDYELPRKKLIFTSRIPDETTLKKVVPQLR